MKRRRGRRVAVGVAAVGILAIAVAVWLGRERLIEHYWLRVLDLGSEESQQRAARKLVELRSQRAVPELIEKLGDGKHFPVGAAVTGKGGIVYASDSHRSCATCLSFFDQYSMDVLYPVAEVGWERVWPAHRLVELAPEAIPAILSAYERAIQERNEAMRRARRSSTWPTEPFAWTKDELQVRAHWLQETIVHLGPMSVPHIETVFDLLPADASVRYVRSLQNEADQAVRFLLQRLEESKAAPPSSPQPTALATDYKGAALHYLLALAALRSQAKDAVPALSRLVQESPDPRVRCYASSVLWIVDGKILVPSSHLTGGPQGPPR